MAVLIESEPNSYRPSSQKWQPYNPYPTHDSVVIFYLVCQVQERIAKFNAPFPTTLSFPMGVTPNIPFPEEPVGGTCQLVYLRSEHKFESRVDHFRISNPNFFRRWDFYVTVYTSTVRDSPPFSVIRQNEEERYGWQGKIDYVHGKLGVIWSKHIVNYSTPETPPPTPPSSPRLQQRHRQRSGHTFGQAGMDQWLLTFRRSCRTAAQLQSDLEEEETSTSYSPVIFRRPSISSGSDYSVSTEDS